MLRDKVAIITGGSRGIGKAITEAYLKEGARVTIVARTASELKSTLKEFKDFNLSKVTAVSTDVACVKKVKKFINKTLSSYGKIDILVNAAGLQAPIGAFIDVDSKDWIKNIHVNLIGTMLCCKHILPVMLSQKAGKIINFSGGGATSPRPNFSAYAVSKTAIVRFTEILAMEVKEYGISVNAISPGAINTRMHKEIIEAGTRAGERERIAALKIIKDGGASAKLVSELALFLASDASDGLTGKLISANWDKWKDLDKQMQHINDSSLYTLRRIDGVNFVEVKR